MCLQPTTSPPPPPLPPPPCRHDFAAAIWRPDLALAEVVLQKGKLLTHMGVTRGNKLFLCIEEAV
jgi:hypothetical protein